MNPDAGTDQLPLPSLARCAGGQSRIPSERHRDYATVLEFDDQSAISDPDLLGDRRLGPEG